MADPCLGMEEKEVFFIASMHSNKKNKDLIDSSGLLKLNLRRNLDYVILDSTSWDQVKEDYDMDILIKNDVYQVFITFSCQGISFKTLYIHGIEKVFDVIQTLFVNKAFGLDAFLNMFEVKMGTIDSIDNVVTTKKVLADEGNNIITSVLEASEHESHNLLYGCKNSPFSKTNFRPYENNTANSLKHTKNSKFITSNKELDQNSTEKKFTASDNGSMALGETYLAAKSLGFKNASHAKEDSFNCRKDISQKHKNNININSADVLDELLFGDSPNIYSNAKLIDPNQSFNSLASSEKKIILFVERKKHNDSSLYEGNAILESKPAYEIKNKIFSELRINSKPKNMSLPNIKDIDKVQDAILESNKRYSEDSRASQIKDINALDLSTSDLSFLASQVYSDEYLNTQNIQNSVVIGHNDDSRKEFLNISGLINLGNTCYINTSLQCLYSCNFFIDHLLTNINSHYKEGSIVLAMTDLLREMRTKLLISPVNIKRAIAAKNSSFNNSDEQDAEEFISTLLDNLHEELKETVKVKPKSNSKSILSDNSTIQKDSNDISKYIQEGGVKYKNTASNPSTSKEEDLKFIDTLIDSIKSENISSSSTDISSSFIHDGLEPDLNANLTGPENLKHDKLEHEDDLAIQVSNQQTDRSVSDITRRDNMKPVNSYGVLNNKNNDEIGQSLHRSLKSAEHESEYDIQTVTLDSRKKANTEELIDKFINSNDTEEVFLGLLNNSRSVISDFFYGMVTSSLLCTNCKFKKTRHEIINNLSLSIPDKIVYHCSSFLVRATDGIFNKILVPLSFTVQEAKNYIAFENNINYPLKSNIIAFKYDKNYPVLQLQDSVSVSSVLNTIVYFEVKNLDNTMNTQHDLIFVRFFFKKLIFFTKKFSLDLVLNVNEFNTVSLRSSLKESISNKGRSTKANIDNFNQNLVLEVLRKLHLFLDKSLDISQFMKYFYVKDKSYSNELGMNTVDVVINDLKMLFGSSLSEFDRIKPFKKNDITISDCLNDYFKDEEVDLRCESCKKDSKYIKSSAIARFPRYLIVQFKRFRFHGSGTKINTFIDFPLERLKIKHASGKEVFYRLMSSANHIEIGLGYGHYMAFVRRDNSWYCCNDSVITKTVGVDKSSSYILFYELCK